jgi:hypothetical protein
MLTPESRSVGASPDRQELSTQLYPGRHDEPVRASQGVKQRPDMHWVRAGQSAVTVHALSSRRTQAVPRPVSKQVAPCWQVLLSAQAVLQTRKIHN